MLYTFVSKQVRRYAAAKEALEIEYIEYAVESENWNHSKRQVLYGRAKREDLSTFQTHRRGVDLIRSMI